MTQEQEQEKKIIKYKGQEYEVDGRIGGIWDDMVKNVQKKFDETANEIKQARDTKRELQELKEMLAEQKVAQPQREESLDTYADELLSSQGVDVNKLKEEIANSVSERISSVKQAFVNTLKARDGQTALNKFWEDFKEEYPHLSNPSMVKYAKVKFDELKDEMKDCGLKEGRLAIAKSIEKDFNFRNSNAQTQMLSGSNTYNIPDESDQEALKYEPIDSMTQLIELRKQKGIN